MASFLPSVKASSLTAAEGTKNPMVLQFFQQCLAPALGDRISFRTSKEMVLLAEAIDLLIVGKVIEASELLMQRFKTLELGSSSGSFETAQYLEIGKGSLPTSVSAQKMELAKATEAMEIKLSRRGQGGARGNSSE